MLNFSTAAIRSDLPGVLVPEASAMMPVSRHQRREYTHLNE